VAASVEQAGVAACVAHTLLLRDEQTPHWPASGEPVGWQAGSAAVGQGFGPGFVAA
jgi:hypothetical protein